MFKWCVHAYPTRSPREREEKMRAASTNHTPRERDVVVLGKCLYALNLPTPNGVHTQSNASSAAPNPNPRTLARNK